MNLAANAYGSDQAYLRLIDAMPRFQRLVATVTLFVPLQLGRNLHDDRPRLVLGPTGELDFVPPATDFLSRLRIRKLLWNGLPYLGDQGDRPDTDPDLGDPPRDEHPDTGPRSDAALRDPRSTARTGRSVEHPEAWIVRALFVQQEIPFILVDIPPDQLLNGDSHPGPRGDETIAAAILAALPPGP